MKTNGVCVEEDVEKRMGSERRKEYPRAHPTSKKKKKKEKKGEIVYDDFDNNEDDEEEDEAFFWTMTFST